MVLRRLSLDLDTSTPRQASARRQISSASAVVRDANTPPMPRLRPIGLASTHTCAKRNSSRAADAHCIVLTIAVSASRCLRQGCRLHAARAAAGPCRSWLRTSRNVDPRMLRLGNGMLECCEHCAGSDALPEVRWWLFHRLHLRAAWARVASPCRSWLRKSRNVDPRVLGGGGILRLVLQSYRLCNVSFVCVL